MKNIFLSKRQVDLNEKQGLYLIIWHQLAGIQEIKREWFRAVIFSMHLAGP